MPRHKHRQPPLPSEIGHERPGGGPSLVQLAMLLVAERRGIKELELTGEPSPSLNLT
jgi:hypothetical protein